MTQAEYKRPRNTGRRKMAVVTLLVLVLCLACFALGIMVGGSGSEEVAEQVTDQTSSSAAVREAPGSAPALSGAEHGEADQVGRQQKSASLQEQTADIPKVQDANGESGTSAQKEEVLVQKAPLGSGINPRKKADAEVVDPQETEPEAESAPRVTDSAPASQGSTSVSDAQQEKSTDPAPVAAAREGKYVVQIASFRAEADAQTLAQKLKPEFPAYVREVDLSEKGIWFRVLVGPLAQRDEADDAQRRIKESVKLEGFVKKAP